MKQPVILGEPNDAEEDQEEEDLEAEKHMNRLMAHLDDLLEDASLLKGAATGLPLGGEIEPEKLAGVGDSTEAMAKPMPEQDAGAQKEETPAHGDDKHDDE